jgi:hypothetical protein
VSDFTGVQAVTSTLRAILRNRMAEPPEVTTAPPEVEVSTVDPPIVNLFLYRISENAALKNQDLPGMTGPMSLGRPPLSLDLHYLVTATGLDATDDRGAHRVLGDAMLTLHDHPVIAKDDPLLDPALQNEVELIKVTMESLDTEDLSKIWTATTAPLRPSAGYKVTVVQLESTLPRTIAKPVLEPPDAGPRVYVVPLDRPFIEAVAVMRLLPDATVVEQNVPYVRIGEQLVVKGTGFFPGTRIELGDVDATASIDAASTAGRMLVTVDDPALQPGLHRIQLIRDVEVGEPPDDRAFPFLRSNVAAFVLIPTVTGIALAADGTVTVDGERLFRTDAPSMVLVGDRAFPLGTGATPTQVEVDISGMPAGTYPVSVRVNGAESINAFTVEVA